MGFLSVVQDSHDSVKLFVKTSLKNIEKKSVSGLGIIVGIYRLILLLVTSTVLSPTVVYNRISCYLFDVRNSSSNPSHLVNFFK